jgi:hypothetical protein
MFRIAPSWNGPARAVSVFIASVSPCLVFSLIPTTASSQGASQSTSACPAAEDVTHQHLQGRWQAELQGAASTQASPGLPRQALLQLGPHPELAQSVRGTVQRGETRALVSGDVDAGDLTLEESINGTTISATWIGRVVDGSCGKEIRGTWNQATPTPTSPSGLTAPFILRKQAGWL